MKKNKVEEINISNKHIRTRVILFAIASIVAVAGFSFGIYSLSKDGKGKDGWNVYSLQADAKYPFYYQNVYLKYYYDKGEASTKSAGVKSLFHLASKNIYSLIDSNKANEGLYKDIKGLSYINNHPCEKIEIDTQLYKILDDAKKKTDEPNSNYSIFAGYLNDYWSYYMNSDSYSINKVYINDVIQLINNDHFNLLLEEENGKYYCTYSYSDEVKKAIEDYDLNDVSALDLNTLFYSYYLDGIYQRLSEGGVTKGVLYTHTGESIYMYSGFTLGNEISLYDYYGYKPSVFAKYISKGKCMVSSIRTFPIYEEYEAEMRFKLAENSTMWMSTNMFFSSLTGYSVDDIKASTAISKDDDICLADLTYENLNYVVGGKIDNISDFGEKVDLFSLKKLDKSIVYKNKLNSELVYPSDDPLERYEEIVINNV